MASLAGPTTAAIVGCLKAAVRRMLVLQSGSEVGTHANEDRPCPGAAIRLVLLAPAFPFGLAPGPLANEMGRRVAQLLKQYTAPGLAGWLAGSNE